MAVSIVMPALEMAQETGKIISWLKKEGDSIAKGDLIAENEKVEVKASPKARRMAQELGVVLATVRGTGPGGIISAEDVEAAAKAPPARAIEPELSTIARLMAERTTQSWTTAPHFFLVREIDASGLIAAREKHGKAITHTDLLVAIVARTLVKHPKMN